MFVKDSIWSEVRRVEPKPLVVAIRERVPNEMLYLRGDQFKQEIKRFMARKLAEFIMNECSIFEAPSYNDAMDGKMLGIEMTINDRGAYQNWRHIDREEGMRIGRKEAINKLPYGMNPNEYWE